MLTSLSCLGSYDVAAPFRCRSSCIKAELFRDMFLGLAAFAEFELAADFGVAGDFGVRVDFT